MTTFLNRALDTLNRLYRFRGGQNTIDSFDLSGPVQPVHDCSREAELGSGIGLPSVAPGYWWLGQANVHPAGNELITTTTDPRGVIKSAIPNQFPIDDLDWDIWWLGAYAWSATAGIMGTQTSSYANYPAVPGQVTPAPELLWYAPTRLSGVGGYDVGLGVATTTPNRPTLLPIGTTLSHVTFATVAVPGTITIVDRIWAGMRGARPPGLA